MASKITSLTIVYSIVYSDADQRKHQSSASLTFVWGIHRWPENFPHKWPVTREMFPFDDVIMDIPVYMILSNACVLFIMVLLLLKFKTGVKLNDIPKKWHNCHFNSHSLHCCRYWIRSENNRGNIVIKIWQIWRHRCSILDIYSTCIVDVHTFQIMYQDGQQIITLTDIDQVIWPHTVSLGHSGWFKGDLMPYFHPNAPGCWFTRTGPHINTYNTISRYITPCGHELNKPWSLISLLYSGHLISSGLFLCNKTSHIRVIGGMFVPYLTLCTPFTSSKTRSLMPQGIVQP